MPSSLPSLPGPFRRVKDFGIGPYDSDGNSSKHGEDDEEGDAPQRNLPDGGPSGAGASAETFLSYPQSNVSGDRIAVPAQLPGDQYSLPSNKGHWKGWSKSPTVPTAPKLPTYSDTEKNLPGPNFSGTRAELPEGTASTELPSDKDNPTSHSDYYDRLITGLKQYISESSYWADADSGAYAGEEEEDDSLPSVHKNETSIDNFLGAIGNAWSGYGLEDISNEYGFPSPDYREVNDKESLGGKVYSMNFDRHQKRTANSHHLASQLAGDFLKKYGKKNITRRHVLAFLQETGNAFRLYLASEIIRCLKLSHKVYITDVMDQFPVAKTASSNQDPRILSDKDLKLFAGDRSSLELLQEIHGQLVDVQTNTHNNQALKVLFQCTANVAGLMAKVS